MTAPARNKIEQLQEEMLKHRCDMPEAEHFFAPGMYGRKFPLPAGMTVVGKRHKHAHFLMILKGKTAIVDEEKRVIAEAGDVFVSQPGVKRVVHALEDTIFFNVHLNPSDTQDLEQIEFEHIEDEGFKLEYHKAITQEGSK